ncbi:MAG: cell division protein ZapA [candidate division Zixibacteria bacterium]|nr:cell division protein ZapA [candidate division Zixibacteria bacterium]
MSEKKSVKVTIYGEEYPIRGDGDIEFIKKIAAFVDMKMREVAEKSYVKSPKDVSVLAALNIASDLFELKEKAIELEAFNSRTETLLQKLDSEIQPTPSS